MRNIFEEGECIICSGEGKREKYLEKKKRKNIWRREILFAEKKEKKENILRREIYFAEEKKNRRGRRKIFGKGKYMFCVRTEKPRGKRRKIS